MYVVGLVLSGAAFEFKLSPGVVVVGWAVRELAVMTNTVAACTSLFFPLPLPLFARGRTSTDVTFHLTFLCMGWADAYANDSFPRHPGEVSALLNLFRTLGGFAVPYFQIRWARRSGALQVFGCEAA